jgi:hypothetical protein
MSLFALPNWRVCFYFLPLGCMCVSVISSPINITITAPAGSSNQGSPNLICTPTTWYAIIIFFGANFFAHPVTIRTLPGENGKEVIFTIVLVLLFPFSCIGRGV